MTSPIPHISAIAAKQSQKEGREIIARQVATESRFEEAVDTGFNPQAAARQQARFNRFRSLENRGKLNETKEKKIEEIAKKAETEDDLAQNFSRRNNELEARKLQGLKSRLKNDATAQEVLDEVMAVFPDPTLADEALDYLVRATSEQLQETVREAKGMLFDRKGREIIAGRNIDPVVKLYQNKGLNQSPTQLRDLYRDITGSPRGHNVLFTELSNQYPFDDLKLVISFLLKGLGFDLKSKGPSIQQAELTLLMTDVRNLQSILWVYLFFRARMKMIRSLFSKKQLLLSKLLTFEELAKEFIRLVEERYPSAARLKSQAEKLGLTEDEAKVIILSQFRDAIRQLSPRLYKTARHKQDLLLVILDTLEELEEEEDEEES